VRRDIRKDVGLLRPGGCHRLGSFLTYDLGPAELAFKPLVLYGYKLLAVTEGASWFCHLFHLSSSNRCAVLERPILPSSIMQSTSDVFAGTLENLQHFFMFLVVFGVA